jgi:hypothetical protein
LALSILQERDVAPLLALNALRNRLAHQLGANATDQDVQTLIRSLSPGQKRMYDCQIEKHSTFPDNLRLLISVLMVQLDRAIQDMSEAQVRGKGLRERLLQLIGKREPRPTTEPDRRRRASRPPGAAALQSGALEPTGGG